MSPRTPTMLRSRSATPSSNPTSPATVQQPGQPNGPDALPENARDLEIRANYHLGEMGRIRVLINVYNDTIRENKKLLNDSVPRIGENMPMSMVILDNLIQYSRDCRDGLHHFVVYHRSELQRVADKREEIDRSQGFPSPVAEMYRKLEKEEDWYHLFDV